MHTNKINNKKYIGITSQSPNSRWREGEGYRLGYTKRTHFYNSICKYGWENFESIVLFENLTSTEAVNKEIELIEKYNTTDRRFGYNITKGGDLGGFKLNISEEERRRRSEYMKHRTISAETREKMSRARSGRSPWNKGKIGIYSDEVKKKISRSKKVIDVYGNIFDSIKECAEHYGIQRTNLNSYINGKIPTPKKYKHLEIKYYDEGVLE